MLVKNSKFQTVNGKQTSVTYILCVPAYDIFTECMKMLKKYEKKKIN